ncbi:MAG: lysophospholipid acyltransferase family protein [Bacteriovoracaceae bacterium]
MILFFVKDERKKRDLILKSMSKCCYLITKVLNIKISTSFDNKILEGKLILANHQSYLDMICLSSITPTTYVTSVDMKESAFLGDIIELCQCLYTERRKEKRTENRLKKEIEDISRILDQGFSVTIFPEGTSSDGSYVKAFKAGLIQSAYISEKEIIPLTICYTNIDRSPFSKENCDKVCWYGDMSFHTHFLELLKLDSIEMNLSLGPTLRTQDFQDHYTLVQFAHQIVSKNFSERTLTL